MRLKILITSLIIVIVSAIGMFHQVQSEKVMAGIPVTYSSTPTIMLHGDAGGFYSTNNFVHEFDKFDYATPAARVRIARNGKFNLQKSAHLDRKNNPVIQMSFEDNLNIRHEATQLATFLKTLKARRGITHVNLVGHSSGANVAYLYMLQHSQDNRYPTVAKFVSISSTFWRDSPNAYKLPKNLQVFNLIGSIRYTGTDGEIKNSQAEEFKQTIGGHVKSYKLGIVHGNVFQSQHSMQHENPQFAREVVKFLWGRHH